MSRKVLYIDMDNVLVDFSTGISRTPVDVQKRYEDNLDDVPSIFSLMDPLEGAIDSYVRLSKLFDTYILSTAPWDNASAWSDKLLWVKKHLGDHAYKRLILSHHKNLLLGDYLVDDRTKNGVDRFSGEHLHFASKQFPNWPSVLRYLEERS